METRSDIPPTMAEPITFLVRDACPDDALAVVSILNPIIETGRETAFDALLTEEQERRYIEELAERAIFLLAYRAPDGQVLGFQSLDVFATYTRAFAHVGVIGTYVDAAFRRQGVASRLFEAMFEAARGKGYEKLFTYIRADNEGALLTYRSQGFRVVGIAREQAKVCGRKVDEVIVERPL